MLGSTVSHLNFMTIEDKCYEMMWKNNINKNFQHYVRFVSIVSTPQCSPSLQAFIKHVSKKWSKHSKVCLFFIFIQTHFYWIKCLVYLYLSRCRRTFHVKYRRRSFSVHIFSVKFTINSVFHLFRKMLLNINKENNDCIDAVQNSLH